MASHIAVIINAGAGTGAAAGLAPQLEEQCAAAGRECRIVAAGDASEISAAARDALHAGAAAVVAGGGDGTVSAVASVLAGGEVPLGILPLGTLNHFARDLGVPLDPTAALQVVLARHHTTIDLGEVNGRCFLNNASLGLYPQTVRLRKRYQARGYGKWLAAALVTFGVLRRYQSMAVRIDREGAVALRRTPIVFIGNNEYRAAGFLAGTRDSLTDGVLAIYVVNAGGRRHPLRLIRLAWHIVRGVALDGDHLELLPAREAEVDTTHHRVHMALDGEVELFETPLRFRIRPAALQVLVPYR
jgi:diacylglycerol kinase family enzyme